MSGPRASVDPTTSTGARNKGVGDSGITPVGLQLWRLHVPQAVAPPVRRFPDDGHRGAPGEQPRASLQPRRRIRQRVAKRRLLLHGQARPLRVRPRPPTAHTVREAYLHRPEGPGTAGAGLFGFLRWTACIPRCGTSTPKTRGHGHGGRAHMASRSPTDPLTVVRIEKPAGREGRQAGSGVPSARTELGCPSYCRRHARASVARPHRRPAGHPPARRRGEARPRPNSPMLGLCPYDQRS
jgi:hypothetical protein